MNNYKIVVRIILFGVLISLIGYGIRTYLLIPKKEFYCENFNGIVQEIIYHERKYISVKLQSGHTYYLGDFYNYNSEHIQVGDSIVKPEKSFYITVFRNDKVVYQDRAYSSSILKCD